MTSTIGKLSNLSLQDSAQNPLTGMCSTNISEGQRLLAETIDVFSKKVSFNSFFSGLTTSVTGSPFNINVTEEKVTITDSATKEHVLKFAEIEDESEKQGLIAESKSLLERINELYRERHHTCGASHGSTASTAVLNLSRVTTIPTHSHHPESSVAGAGAEADPRRARDAAAHSLSPDSQRDLATIVSSLDLLQASLHAREIQQTGQWSGTPAQSTLFTQKLADIHAKHPSLLRNQKLDELVAAMEIRRPASSGLEAFPLIESLHTHALIPSPPESQQASLLSGIEAQSTLSAEEKAAIKAQHPSFKPNDDLNALIAALGIRIPEASALRTFPLLSSPLTPTQSQQNHSQSLRNASIMTPQHLLASVSKPSFLAAEALSLEQSRLALVKHLDTMDLTYHIAPSATPLLPPGPIHTQQNSQALHHFHLQGLFILNRTPNHSLTSLSQVSPKRTAVHRMTPQPVLPSDSTTRPKLSFTAEEALSVEQRRLELVKFLDAIDAKYSRAPSPTQIVGPLGLQAELPPIGRQQPQTPALLRTLTADPQSPIAARQEPIIAIPSPLQQEASELSLRAATLQPPVTPAQPALRKPSLVERKIHSIHEIKATKPSALTTAQTLIREQERAKELKKQELAGRAAETRARHNDIKRSYKKQGR
ncbi:MAG: hypothetical protein NTX49_09530 [Chlamydiae bacterium]|nr:hypothetical protein [Chlamydiota bacterium]